MSRSSSVDAKMAAARLATPKAAKYTAAIRPDPLFLKECRTVPSGNPSGHQEVRQAFQILGLLIGYGLPALPVDLVDVGADFAVGGGQVAGCDGVRCAFELDAERVRHSPIRHLQPGYPAQAVEGVLYGHIETGRRAVA